VAELLIAITGHMRLQHPDPICNGRNYKKLFECHTGNLYELYFDNQIESFNRVLAAAHHAIDEQGKNPPQQVEQYVKDKLMEACSVAVPESAAQARGGTQFPM
jgi:hypothetical protein